MNKTKFLAFAAAALMFASCTSELATKGNNPELAADGNIPVAFQVSANQNGAQPRRIGANGIVNDLETLKSDDYKKFGVFGFYTNKEEFSEDSIPNFMYNQKVEWNGTIWEYAPVKYWPNEWNATLEGNTTTDGNTDHLSFFAYAPYVSTADVEAIADKTTETGIYEISANDATGAPYIKYRATKEGTGVDLLWGVAKEDYMSRDTKIVNAGYPFLNLIKPTTANEKIPFHFRHALGMFGATVSLYVDNAEYDADNTKVMLKEVELLSSDNTKALFYTQGTLSLNNTTANEPEWSDKGGDVTSYNFDLTDMTENIAYTAPTGSESVYEAQGTHTGVGTAKQNLTKGTQGAMFVPGQGTNFKVRVKYVVITKDETLAAKCSVIENNITSDEIAGFELKAGMTSILNIQLGLKQVMFDVTTVEGWGLQDDEDQTTINLSKDKPKGFSVSPTKIVRFSSGNLQYNYTDSKWQFAETQYTIVGDANATNIQNKTGIIDLFGWGDTGDANSPKGFKTSYNYSDYAWSQDWGTAAAADLGTGWYTLSTDEWQYLFYTRTNAASLFGQATVAGQTGLIVLPDEDAWTLPAGLTFNAGSYNAFADNTYDATQWDQMAAAGAVFLPAAGYRNGTGMYDVGDNGYYWSSSANFTNGAWVGYFDDGYFYAAGNYNRDDDQSVRLVASLSD